VIDADEVAANLVVGEHVQNVVERSCEGPGPTPLRQFMSVLEMYAILHETKCEQVLSEVPRGVKENVWYVVDNSGNVERQADGKKNIFWDDCGAWSSKDGHVVKRTYVVSGKRLSVVQVVNGLYCKQQVVNKKRSWVPLEVQPCTDAVVVVSSFYTTLKDDSSYRKKVSWLSVQPNIAVYEYQGRPPLIKGILHSYNHNFKSELDRYIYV